MDVSGLATAWESISGLRGLTRDHGVLMKFPAGEKFCEANRQNAVLNTDVLLPCLRQMRLADTKLPYLEPLQHQIEEYFKSVHVVSTEQIVYRTSNEIKKMLSFLKRKANKLEVTKAGVR